MRNREELNRCIAQSLKDGRFYERFVEAQIKINFPQSFCKHIEDFDDNMVFRVDGKQCTKTEVDEKYHIDLFLKFDKNKERMQSMDAKSPKRLKRQDTSYKYDIEYVEFTNVNGEEGWVRGRADFIAFVTNVDIIIVSRHWLFGYSNDIVKPNTPIYIGNIADKYPNDYLHKLSRRKDRKDLITILSTEEIRKIAKEQNGLIMQFDKSIDWNQIDQMRKNGEDVTELLDVDATVIDYRKQETKQINYKQRDV